MSKTMQVFKCAICQTENVYTGPLRERVIVPSNWYCLYPGPAYQGDESHKLVFCSVDCLHTYSTCQYVGPAEVSNE